MGAAERFLIHLRVSRQQHGQTWLHGCRCTVDTKPAGVVGLSHHFSSNAKSSEGLAGAYQKLVDGGKLQAGDLAQETVVSALDGLSRDIADKDESSWLRSTVKTLLPWSKRLIQPNQHSVRGIYMHGGVGTGKTMLMDLFYNNVHVTRKRRMHFHAFMLEVHMRLHKLVGVEKGSGDGSSEGPIRIVARQIFDESRVLCLDEVEVTDVADALILKRLFDTLWPEGVVLVATSNTTPDQLYRNGLNRHLFVPFIHQLKEYCHVYSLDGGKDYRKGLTNGKQVFMYPLTDDVDEAMKKEFLTLTGGAEGRYESISVMMGRQLKIHGAKGVARAPFSYLCGGAFGAADYYAVAQHYRALVLERIPWLGDSARENELRRFITLVDVLYESNTILICSAALPLERLFDENPGDLNSFGSRATAVDHRNTAEHVSPSTLQVVGEGGSSGRSTAMIGDVEWSGTGRPGVSVGGVQRSSFTRLATARIISRLMEMQSDAYITRAEQRRAGASGMVLGQSTNRQQLSQ